MSYVYQVLTPEQIRILDSDPGWTSLEIKFSQFLDTAIVQGGGGISSFLDLNDVPATYAGSGGYTVAVNGTETGLTFLPPLTVPTTFVGLTDTPADYSGSTAGDFLKVNGTNDGIEFVAGGGTGTKTTWNGVLTASESVIITHPAVPLANSKDISCYAWLTTNGENGGIARMTWELVDTHDSDTYWDIPDLNVFGATWVDDGGVTGHFSVKPGDISKFCQMRVNGTTYTISILTGDGTNAGEVTHDGEAIGGPFAIDWIRGIGYYNGVSQSVAPGASNAGFWRWCKTKAANQYSAADNALLDVFADDALAGTVGVQNNGRIKCAVSTDGGATWLWHDGTSWATMLESEFATKGIEYMSWGWYVTRAEPVTFTGTGADDATFEFTTIQSNGTNYVIEIDGGDPTDPNTFKWSNDGGSTWEATGVAITGTAQLLDLGTYVVFGATTGHVTGDNWNFTSNRLSMTGLWPSADPVLAGKDIRWMFAFYGEADVDYGYLQNPRMMIHALPTARLLPYYSGYSFTGLMFERQSDTEVKVTNSTYLNMNVLDIVIVTP